MSRWTGKFDFYDDCEMIHTSDEMVECSDVYLGDAKVEIKSKNDLIPYYTHTIASACYSKSEGNTIHLSRESFIDSEEKDFLVWRIMDAIRIARKARKEKKHFNLDYLRSENYFHCKWSAGPYQRTYFQRLSGSRRLYYWLVDSELFL